MAQRRSPQRLSSSPSSGYHRKNKQSLRHSSATRRALAFVNRFQRSTIGSHASRASAPSSSDTVSVRPILATLQPNLRRLPCRQYLIQKNTMRDVSQNFDVPVGSKRKRVVALNENAHANGRPMRGSGRPKRRRAVTVDSETDDEATLMDVDAHHHRWSGSDDSEADSDRESSCKLYSYPSSSDAYGEIADEFLINEASTRQLLRLRKDELVRLYVAAGLSDDTESLTKPELVDAIISARDDIASLPPSSSPGRGDGNSSDFSSDDGNTAGDEETDAGTKYAAASSLRRRVTVNVISKITTRALKTRSLSLGQLNTHPCPLELSTAPEKELELEITTRLVHSGVPFLIRPSFGRRRNTRLTSGRSPTMSSSNPLPSPPATRLRTRKGSGEHPPSQVVLSKAKTKARQVEFSEDVQARSPPTSGDESELTDLAELEAKISATSRTPRRLRSRDRVIGDATPRQGARCKGALKPEDCEVEEIQCMDDEEEVDELISSPSPSPPPENGRRTPVKRRLRPRRAQTHTPPRDDGSEGDDEEEEDQVKEDVMEEMDDEDIESLHEDEDVDVDKFSHPVETTPLKLRSGKVVGGEDFNGEEEEQDDQEIDLELESVDVDAEGAEDVDADEVMEEEDCKCSSPYMFSMLMVDEVDLTLATKKTLIRLRRDDLVRLCETRDLDVAGTKPQLAQSLLQWRDRHANGFSSPSSTGTVRPPSTIRVRGGRRRTKSRSHSTTPPVLTRPQRAHQDEPCTPPISNEQQNQPEQELELDLESLGLEDREIPPDKLTKLEKIGSGGFKDVYIGKFKGRRVAIAEFRDQLSSSLSSSCFAKVLANHYVSGHQRAQATWSI